MNPIERGCGEAKWIEFAKGIAPVMAFLLLALLNLQVS
jgi:hypothetical protein